MFGNTVSENQQILFFPKRLSVPLSSHFNTSEFACHCDYSSCSVTGVVAWAVPKLEKMRRLAGKPLHIKSAYRCDKHQADLRQNPKLETSGGLSTHQEGRAWDVSSPGYSGKDLAKIARAAGFKAVGIGSDFVHIDGRMDGPREWTYDY